MRTTDWKLEQKRVRLESLSTRDRLKLIYEWVKTDDINLAQFAELITETRERTGKTYQ